jgi:hypothetical protein
VGCSRPRQDPEFDGGRHGHLGEPRQDPDEGVRDQAPVTALAGVSEGDAEHLKSAFNIKTVADMAKNKQFRAAMLIAGLAEADGK